MVTEPDPEIAAKLLFATDEEVEEWCRYLLEVQPYRSEWHTALGVSRHGVPYCGLCMKPLVATRIVRGKTVQLETLAEHLRKRHFAHAMRRYKEKFGDLDLCERRQRR